ncbi:MAG: hypothetical protein P4M12_04060 [Gammaproteobacteria bacterium]|nr:hypothetical protein [Gammaproteobacteria bacterium]
MNANNENESRDFQAYMDEDYKLLVERMVDGHSKKDDKIITPKQTEKRKVIQTKESQDLKCREKLPTFFSMIKSTQRESTEQNKKTRYNCSCF